MEQTVDVIIVGGGVIGCSIAYHLSKRGIKVRLLERGRIASEASSAAAGMLAAQAEFIDSVPLFDWARQSRAMFPALTADLQAHSGMEIGLVQQGLLRVATSEEDVLRYHAQAELQRQSGESAQWLSAQEALALEGTLASDVYGALYLENDHQVVAPSLTLAYASAAAALGAEIREHSEVQELLREGGRITGVRMQDGIHRCQQVIIASSIWSQALLRTVGYDLPLYPVKGECIAVRTNKPLIRRTIYTDNCYLVPKANGELLIGATVTPHTMQRHVTVGGILALMGVAERLIPSIRGATWIRTWSGLRPQTPQGLPYIGNHPELAGLMIAAGHYRNGILLSPLTGSVMADLVEGIELAADLTAFQVPAMRWSKDQEMTGVGI
ncbi:glycine oxidase ThiO [Paenibacillus guangzhouensis]|uniref:glycine oxidase ThiO n=1 Tax=Paenibacillus guangzhouensis TaxID=1473112 RepID=UPI001266B9A0|nr:glycine oxidase ThiO [Paenibacillus guangzhouensis]